MNRSAEHHAEQALLRAVRHRRRQRNLRRRWTALAAIAIVVSASWLQLHNVRQPDLATPRPTVYQAYREVTTGSSAYTLVRTTTESSLVVVHTGEMPLPLQIDDRGLFALLPNAAIKVDENNHGELILPQ